MPPRVEFTILSAVASNTAFTIVRGFCQHASLTRTQLEVEHGPTEDPQLHDFF